MRGLGATLVLVGHTAAYWKLPYLPSGAVCVDLFFLLSGFVIAFSYEPKFAQSMSVGEFMQHRIIRLYPLYVLSLALMAVVVLLPLVGDSDAKDRLTRFGRDLLPELFMLPSPDSQPPGKLYPLNGPAWTLLSEIIVNLFYAAIWRHLTTQRLVALVAVAAAALLAAILAYGGIDAGALWKTAPAGLARGFFGFFAGVLVFRLVGSPAQPGSRHTAWAFLPFIAIPAAAFVPTSDALRPWYDALLVIGFGMLFLFICQRLQPPRSLVGGFIGLGRITYGAYILHYPFKEALDWAAGRYPPLRHDLAPLIGMAFVAVVLAVAYVTERWYDRPVRRFIVGVIRARVARRRPPGVIAPPSPHRSTAPSH